MNEKDDSSKNLDEAEIVRQACISAAKEGFMDASISGLCNEGAIEAAISAIRNLDLNKVLADQKDK
jgi:hypothetical protein